VQLRPGIKVFSQNKKFLGRIQHLLLDQITFALNGLVVQHHRALFETCYTIVPLHLFWSSLFAEPINHIQLELSLKQFRSLGFYRERSVQTEGIHEYMTWLLYSNDVFYYPSLSTPALPPTFGIVLKVLCS